MTNGYSYRTKARTHTNVANPSNTTLYGTKPRPIDLIRKASCYRPLTRSRLGLSPSLRALKPGYMPITQR